MSRGGFTLVEAIVALTLTTLVVGLVSSVFLAQNDFYVDVVRRSEAHDNARSVVRLVAGDVRPAPASGIVVADSLQLVLDVPVSMGVVCASQPNVTAAYFPRGGSGLDTVSIDGYGVRSADGEWRFYPDTWSGMYLEAGPAIAGLCADAGMDTTGLDPSHFLRIDGPGSALTFPPVAGGALMLRQEVELSIAESLLDPDYMALFRGSYGAARVEFASGLGEDTHFAYRLRGESGFVSRVSAGDLDRIDAVRVTVRAISGIEGSGSERYEYTLERDIPLKNQ